MKVTRNDKEVYAGEVGSTSFSLHRPSGILILKKGGAAINFQKEEFYDFLAVFRFVANDHKNATKEREIQDTEKETVDENL